MNESLVLGMLCLRLLRPACLFVSFCSARDFPDVFGNKNEVIAATIVIVFFSVIVMGACCELLLYKLDIRMGVDNDEYMREWRNRRRLNGPLHRIGKSRQIESKRSESNRIDGLECDVTTELQQLLAASSNQSMLLTHSVSPLLLVISVCTIEKQFVYDVVVRGPSRDDDNSIELPDKPFHLTSADGSLARSMSFGRSMSFERATTASTTARTLMSA